MIRGKLVFEAILSRKIFLILVLNNNQGAL
jgi:hypothetical protein